MKLYCNALLKTYNKHLAKLSKGKKTADEEIEKLQVLRQTLVEKNLAGVYSDDIFKEQNTMIEEKLIAAHASKSDELVEKYDINKLLMFLQGKLTDLPKTYSKSVEDKKMRQVHSLISTIFMSGFNWAYPGISDYQISPSYQEILDADQPGVQIGWLCSIRSEPMNGQNHISHSITASDT